ncbi:MAG: efflux RND transporter periplasmic adaptor subunit [Candidatus Eisenbacteria bacterium]|uniref:Efflux RND transporter periplasmic adaptor subunit n=1 Tax=Eiseniibacteriota bacterium TaxID=2212470 RepID=A0A7Y2E8S5_UNCEI|nr:efflux RND transporter periplasmic adaptor subunit [Candidatus Eisenbacteria bacterium]
MSKKRGLRVFSFVLIGLILLAGGAFFAQQQFMGGSEEAIASADSTGTNDTAENKSDENEEEEKEEVRVPVELAVANHIDIPSYFQSTGSLEPRRQINLVTKAAGQVTRLRFDEGDMVKKGQILLEMDRREEAIELEKAEVNVATAKRELERTQELSGKGLAADREQEETQKALDLAKHERDLAKVRLENMTLRAPFEGRITERTVELGQTLTVGQSILTLADISPLEVKLFLPEKLVTSLRVGQTVEIRPDIEPDRILDGSVYQISPVVDAATSTVKVTLQVMNKLGGARMGSFVRARITTDIHENVVAIPKRSLVPEAGANYVFIAEADSVRKVPVVVGYSDDDNIEITEGLAPGESVVKVGQGGLRHGSKIRDLAKEEEDKSESLASTDGE